LSSDLQQQLQDVLGTTYRIDRELGGAGMSRVFVALEEFLHRFRRSAERHLDDGTEKEIIEPDAGDGLR
jgi:hypothetical protein